MGDSCDEAERGWHCRSMGGEQQPPDAVGPCGGAGGVGPTRCRRTGADAVTFHPLASVPVPLCLARFSSSSRRRLEASSSACHHFARRELARGHRVIFAFANREGANRGFGVGNDWDDSKEEIRPEEAPKAWKIWIGTYLHSDEFPSASWIHCLRFVRNMDINLSV